MSKKGCGLFTGLAIGAGLGLLFAPKKGSDLRKDIKKKIDEVMHHVDQMTVEDIKKEFTDKVDEVKKGLEDLDKEKVLKIAKKKSEEIKEKLDDLYELAKKKATPVVEGAVEDLRNSAIKVTKEVLTKLEKVEK